MVTGSRIERAVSSSLERLQEKSSKLSMEQFSTFSRSGMEWNLRIRVPCTMEWNEIVVVELHKLDILHNGMENLYKSRTKLDALNNGME